MREYDLEAPVGSAIVQGQLVHVAARCMACDTMKSE